MDSMNLVFCSKMDLAMPLSRVFWRPPHRQHGVARVLIETKARESNQRWGQSNQCWGTTLKRGWGLARVETTSNLVRILKEEGIVAPCLNKRLGPRIALEGPAWIPWRSRGFRFAANFQAK
jgi:hypothetical protein